jgi:hypothetical protein
MIEALIDVEEEFCLPPVERVGAAGRFYLTAETFVVEKGFRKPNTAPVLTTNMKISRLAA